MKTTLFISHKISTSDIQVGTNGMIDTETEELNSVVFRNQGTRNVLINNIILAPNQERSYSVQDESNLISKIDYVFDETVAGTNILVITRAKRVRSVAYEVKVVPLNCI